MTTLHKKDTDDFDFQALLPKLGVRIMERASVRVLQLFALQVSFEDLVLLQTTSSYTHDMSQNVTHKTELEVCVVSVNKDLMAVESSEQEITAEELVKVSVCVKTKLLILFTTVDDRQCDVLIELFDAGAMKTEQFEIRGYIACDSCRLETMLKKSGTTDVLMMSSLPPTHVTSLALPQIEKLYFEHAIQGSDEDFLEVKAPTVLVPGGSFSPEGVKRLFEEWRLGTRRIEQFRCDFTKVHLARRLFRQLGPEVVWSPKVHRGSCLKELPLKYLQPFVAMNMEFYRWVNVNGEVLTGYLHKHYIELRTMDPLKMLMNKLSLDNYIRITGQCKVCNESSCCHHVQRVCPFKKRKDAE